MKILAIDPGTTESAFVVWDGAKAELFVKDDNKSLLARMRAGDFDDCDCVIEKVASYGMAVGEAVFETVFWSGRFAEAFASRTKKSFARMTRLEVKIHHCYTARATDSNIRQALIDKLGAPGTKKAPGPTFGISGDMWQALAVAIAYSEKRETLATIESK